MGLDGVEMILQVEEDFQISISDGDAERLVTARDLIEAVCRKVELSDEVVGEDVRMTACLSQRAFYKVRSELVKVIGVDRSAVRLETSVEELFPVHIGRKLWRKFVEQLHMRGMPWYGSWLRGHLAPRTVREIVERLVIRNPTYLSHYGTWNRERVREHVRSIISEQLEVHDFDDDDEFVRDLGLS